VEDWQRGGGVDWQRGCVEDMQAVLLNARLAPSPPLSPSSILTGVRGGLRKVGTRPQQATQIGHAVVKALVQDGLQSPGVGACARGWVTHGMLPNVLGEQLHMWSGAGGWAAGLYGKATLHTLQTTPKARIAHPAGNLGKTIAHPANHPESARAVACRVPQMGSDPPCHSVCTLVLPAPPTSWAILRVVLRFRVCVCVRACLCVYMCVCLCCARAWACGRRGAPASMQAIERTMFKSFACTCLHTPMLAHTLFFQLKVRTC